jgi:hypothetical protein
VNDIDRAAARIQDLVRAIPGITIKSAPDYPGENAEPLPFCVVYAANGAFHATNATVLHNFPVIAVEFHFSRLNLKQMQQQINTVVYEFPRRLAGDPTLDGNVITVLMTQENQVEYTSGPFEWAGVTTHRLLFPVPIKLRPTPQTTA